MRQIILASLILLALWSLNAAADCTPPASVSPQVEADCLREQTFVITCSSPLYVTYIKSAQLVFGPGPAGVGQVYACQLTYCDGFQQYSSWIPYGGPQCTNPTDD